MRDQNGEEQNCVKCNILKINFSEKFNERRGRINCSLRDEEGWRFAGFQFVKN